MTQTTSNNNDDTARCKGHKNFGQMWITMHINGVDKDKRMMKMVSKHEETMQSVDANNESEMTAANDDVDN